MRFLAVETSSPVFSVALCDGDRLVGSLHSTEPATRSDFLTGGIQRLLRLGGWRLQELDGFALSIGPGSFTGLRVGVTTVKTLAWALKRPVLPVSSLEVIAHNAAGGGSTVFLFQDARKGKVYTAGFQPDGQGRLKRLSPDELLPPEEALKRIAADGKAVLLGDGIRRYQPLLTSMDGKGLILAPESDWIPRAELLGRIAAGRWPEGALDDPHRLVPQYLYSKESDITGW
ncbi:MAG: tRNA (adenosine(37)-N6)-threonylcarbamoyltransferase complex dimerization subunit type 1 TsaB [Candidatus Omnitrophica bacterium]|nr:tRNA (adenosine(37)-N6)-threonylcarbamoyltransferase complex dimerization subunit type 1 TsaB [Candidatus Omnitrophota bacterium]